MLFFILCVYLSLYYIRPFEWVKIIQGEPIFQVFGIISMVAILFATFFSKGKLFRYKTDVMMVGFTFAIILSHLSHGYFGGALDSFTTFCPSLIGYFLVIYALDSKRKIHCFVLLLISLTSLLAFEACLQSIHGVASGGLAPLIEYQGYRNGVSVGIPRAIWYGTFNDPNDLGLALILPIPFLIDRLINRKYLVTLFSLPLLLYGVYLTNSRGAMFALTVSILVYFLLRFRSAKGVALGLVLAGLLLALGPSRVAQLADSDESFQGRVDSWYEGLQMFKSNPVFGVGKGMYTDFNGITAHNSYMLILAEEGIIGSFFYIGLFFYPLRWAKLNLLNKSSFFKEETDRSLLSASIGSLSGLMTAMFFLSRSYILLPFMMIAFLTSQINCSAEGQNDSELDQISDGFHWRILAVGVVVEIILLLLIVKVFL